MKNTLARLKILFIGIISVLSLSAVQLPKAHAADSCFIATSYQEIIWDDPHHTEAFYLSVGSVCEIKLYDLDVTFSDIDAVEGLIPIHSDNSDDLTNVKDRGMRVWWSGSEDELEDVDYVELSPDDSGGDIFGYWYAVPMSSLNPPTTFKRNMPITINSAHYEVNGEMKEIKNLVFDSVLVKAPDSNKDTLMISGVEKQDVTYTGQPVALNGDLTVEENDDGITAEDLTEQYYIYDDSDLSFTSIDRPTDPGEFYLVEYNFENDNYRASLRVPFTIKDYITVDTNVWGGHGEVAAPHYVDKGGNLHVDIIPADGYEVVWVEHNGDDVTDLLGADNSLDLANVNENAYIEVAFRPFYLVTEGDGNGYTIGSGKNLDFVVDKDPASYTDGDVTIMVDGRYIDLRYDSVVKPETQTTTLLSSYLDTLAVGEHQIEIYFFDTPGLAGIARASFTVVETAEDTEDASDSEFVPVPDTGTFTSTHGSASPIGQVTAATVVMLILAVFITKKIMEKK